MRVGELPLQPKERVRPSLPMVGHPDLVHTFAGRRGGSKDPMQFIRALRTTAANQKKSR